MAKLFQGKRKLIKDQTALHHTTKAGGHQKIVNRLKVIVSLFSRVGSIL